MQRARGMSGLPEPTSRTGQQIKRKNEVEIEIEIEREINLRKRQSTKYAKVQMPALKKPQAFDGRLLAQTQFFDQCSIAVGVTPLQIIEQLAALADHFEQTAA